MKKGEGEEPKKKCGACQEDLVISAFSKKQWQLKSQRRCKECIASDKPACKVPPPAISKGNAKQVPTTPAKHSKKNQSKATTRPNAMEVAMRYATTPAGAQQPAARQPPTIEHIREVRRLMLDPNHLAEMMKGKHTEELFRANPEYARACANNPFNQDNPFWNGEISPGEIDMKHLEKVAAELHKNMTDEQMLEIMTSQLTVTEEEKKVSMKAAKNLTNEASCWVCLDNGPDEDGNPLVRDCSCRGNSGFAHFSCVKKYAKSKGMKPIDVRFIKHWDKCPHCLQDYQGDLAVALSDACLAYYDNAYLMYKESEYTEKGAGYKLMRYIARCMIMMNKFIALEALAIVDAQITERWQEAIQAGEEIISLLGEMGKLQNDPYCRGKGVKFPSKLEIDTCKYLSRLYSCKITPENNKMFIKYTKRAIRACKDSGEDEEAKHLEQTLETHKAKISRKFEGIREESEYKQSESALPYGRDCYDVAISINGENSSSAIAHGKTLGLMLLQSGYGIECERFFTKLVVTSRCVYGPDHPETGDLNVCLEQAKWRTILIPNPFDKNARPNQMRVVGYEGEGTRYALSGMTKKDPRSLSIKCDDDETYYIQPGTPVVCKGLQGATHLNGQIGDVRRRDKSTKRYAVHFADSSLKPKSILGRNLRVLINVPDENEVTGDSYMH